MKYLGYVARKDGWLENICLSGNVEGKRRRCREKTRWSDGIVKRTRRGVEELVVMAQEGNQRRSFVRETTSARGLGIT